MRSKYSAIAIALLVSMGSFAQKDELKTLKKIYEKDQPTRKDMLAYKEALSSATPLVLSTNEEDTVYLNFYKSNVPLVEMMLETPSQASGSDLNYIFKFFTPEIVKNITESYLAVFALEKKTGKLIFTKEIKEDIQEMKPVLLSYAVDLGAKKQYSEASTVLYSLYQMDDTDLEKLYYAASYAVNAKEYDKALQYYGILKNQNYSGEKVNYSAISIISEKEEFFASKADRDRAVAIKTHNTPKDEKEPSKRGEIYRNIALILISEGKGAEAKAAVMEARKANPDDVSLIMSEADIYLKEKDMVTYSKLINEVLEKDPSNPDLYYNLGVISYQNKDYANAEKYYLKALELKPDYVNAYFNLAAVKLDASSAVLDKMNVLGNTAAENKKYEVLKDQRAAILKESIVLLEKTISLDKGNTDAKEVLLSVYKALEMTDKAKALQAELDK